VVDAVRCVSKRMIQIYEAIHLLPVTCLNSPVQEPTVGYGSHTMVQLAFSVVVYYGNCGCVPLNHNGSYRVVPWQINHGLTFRASTVVQLPLFAVPCSVFSMVQPFTMENEALFEHDSTTVVVPWYNHRYTMIN